MWMVPQNFNIFFCLQERDVQYPVNFFLIVVFSCLLQHATSKLNALEDALRGLDEDERESLSDSSSIDDVE